MDQNTTVNQEKTKSGWLKEYRIRSGLVRRYAFLTVLTLLLATGSSAWVLYSWFYAVTRYGPASIWNWTRIPLLVTALLIPVFFFFLIRWNYLSRIVIQTHTHGLRIIRSSTQLSIPWASIAELYTESTHFGVKKFIWKQKNRVRLATTQPEKQIRIPGNLEKVDDLLGEMKSGIYPFLVKRYDQMLISGDSLKFGPIQISRESLKAGRLSVPWDRIEQVHLDNGVLKLSLSGTKRSRQVSLKVSRIPNLDICYQLIRKMSAFQ